MYGINGNQSPTCATLLRWLEQQLDAAAQLPLPRLKQLGSTQQHGHVCIMPTRVHAARRLRWAAEHNKHQRCRHSGKGSAARSLRPQVGGRRRWSLRHAQHKPTARLCIAAPPLQRRPTSKPAAAVAAGWLRRASLPAHGACASSNGWKGIGKLSSFIHHTHLAGEGQSLWLLHWESVYVSAQRHCWQALPNGCNNARRGHGVPAGSIRVRRAGPAGGGGSCEQRPGVLFAAAAPACSAQRQALKCTHW